VVSNSGYDNVLVDQSAGKVSISNSTFSNAGQNGIEANGVAGLDLSSVTVSGNGNALNEEGIKLSNLSGSSTWTNLTVSNSFTDNVFIDQTSGTIASLAISGSTFSGAPQHGILLQPRGTTVVSSFTVSSSTFSNNASTGVFVSAADSANVAGAVVQTSTFTNNGVHIDFSKGQSASLQFKVLNNQTMTGAVSHAINVASGTDVTTGGFLKGRIENNKIGAAKAVGSTGSTSGDGIRVLAQAQTQGWVLINNNQIYQTPNAHGIQAFGRNGNPAPSGLDVTITNNDVDTGVDSNNASAVANALSAISVLADCATVCNHTRADISGNTVPSWAPGSDFVAGQLIVVQTGTPNPTPSIFDLVGTGANALAKLQATNTGLMATSGTINLIAGPINIPP
jgi:hypothetical protein